MVMLELQQLSIAFGSTHFQTSTATFPSGCEQHAKM